MPLEWIAIAPAVLPFLKKYANDLTNKLVSKSEDGIFKKLQSHIFPEQKLIQANEAFLTRFTKELDSSMDLPTLNANAYEEALGSFLCNPNVQDAILAPLEGESKLDWEMLSGIWAESRSASGEPLIPLPADFDWAKVAKTYQQAIERQMLSDSNLRDLLKALAAIRSAQATERTANASERIVGPVAAFDLTRYAKAVKEAYAHLKLGSLDADWTHYERRIRLENVYVPQSVKQALPPRDVTRDYLQLLRKEGRLSGVEVEGDELRSKRAEYEQLSSRPLMEVVDDSRKRLLVILGDPGLGKSTLLKRLTLRWAEQPSLPLALLIELRYAMREWPKETFLRYLEKSDHQPSSLPEIELDDHLKRKDSLVLFDGLDEVPAGQREDAVKKVIRFAQQYERARVIVTTRIHGYHPGSHHPELFRDAGFQQFTLQDFEKPEIDRFVALWHQAAFEKPTECKDYRKRLQAAVDESPAVRELAANPLLLTMMAVLNRNQELPRNRVKLYERCAELLLKNWDLEKFPNLAERHDTQDIRDKLGPDQKMNMLEEVAAAMQSERTGIAGNLISETALQGVVRKGLTQLEVEQAWAVADDLISLLRERNFMLAYVGDDQYAFVHRTFLEYFAARHLKHTASTEELQALFREKWDRDEWLEILRLLCGLMAAEGSKGAKRAGLCIAELLSPQTKPEARRAVFLAAECLREVPESGLVREQREVTRGRLLSLMSFGFHRFYFSVRIVGMPGPAEEAEHTRSRAVREFVRGWRSDPSTIEWLKDRATASEDFVVRQTALEELACGWKDHTDTLPWLKERASSDGHAAVQRAAVHELAREWKDDPETLRWLKDRAGDDSDVRQKVVPPLAVSNIWLASSQKAKLWREAENRAAEPQRRKDNVREAAVQELAWGWRDDHDTLRILKERVTRDPNASVQRAALEELVQGWKDDPDTLSMVKKVIVNDESDWSLREMAVDKLVRVWKDDPDALRIVQRRATDDEAHPNIREKALRDLAWGWKDDPNTFRILKDRANKKEESSQVRGIALWELARGWKNHPDTLPLLKELVGRDKDEYVRLTALNLLFEGWKDDPDSFRILKERVSADESHWVQAMAVQHLARGWKDDPDMLPWLKKLAVADPDYKVRETALEELARGWKDDPDTFRFVKERATDDDDVNVREQTLRAVARAWRDDPAITTWLKHRAIEDTAYNVRQGAIVNVVQWWKDDPETLRWLKDRVIGNEKDGVRKAAVEELLAFWDDDPETARFIQEH